MLATLVVVRFFFFSDDFPKLKARDYESFPNEISARGRAHAHCYSFSTPCTKKKVKSTLESGHEPFLPLRGGDHYRWISIPHVPYQQVQHFMGSNPARGEARCYAFSGVR